MSTLRFSYVNLSCMMSAAGTFCSNGGACLLSGGHLRARFKSGETDSYCWPLQGHLRRFHDRSPRKNRGDRTRDRQITGLASFNWATFLHKYMWRYPLSWSTAFLRLRQDPTGIQRWYNVDLTLNWRCFNVVCPLRRQYEEHTMTKQTPQNHWLTNKKEL